jgi:hypothetical protein
MSGIASGSHMLFQLAENKGFMRWFDIGRRAMDGDDCHGFML